MYSRQMIAVVAILCATGSLQAQNTPAQGKNTKSELRIHAYKNGHWFDGKSFSAAKSMYSVNGILHPNRPFKVDEEVDLKGAYVIPACGEAHNHNATADNDRAIDAYLKSGILYVKNPSNLPQVREGARINSPTGIDVSFSNGSLTSPGGHPVGLVKRNIERGVMKPEDGEGAFYHTIDSLEDLDEKLPKLLASKPDFVKTILVYSEEFEKRKNNEKYFSRRGLSPVLLKPIVERVHKAGLTVATHVESAADFHVAVEAGTDEINHMPGFWPTDESLASHDFSHYRIAEADARRARQRKIRVVTTLGESIDKLKAGQDSAARDGLIEVYRHNINLLKKYSVPILMGSDQFRKNSQAEVLALADAKLMSNLELVKSWCEVTPQAIFPKRRLGKLRDGYEANFVVLDKNTIQDVGAINDVRLVFKAGKELKGASRTVGNGQSRLR